MIAEATSVEMELALLLEEALPFSARLREHCAEKGQAVSGHGYSIPASWGEKRCREFLAGRKAAEKALTASGRSPCEIPRDPDGVPRFPPGVSGSITHTGARRTRAFSVVTEAPRRVGLDAEEIRVLGPGLHAHIVDADELASLRPGPLELGLAVLAAFSAKEAFYKCVYPAHQRFIGFREVAFTYQERHAGRFARILDCQVQHRQLDLRREGMMVVAQDLLISLLWDSHPAPA